MSQIPRLSACPSCAEPLDPGDRFCGACGYDLSAVPAPPGDHPTVTLHAAGRAATAPAEAERPTPPPAAAPSPPPPPPPLVPPVAAGAGDRPPVVPPGPAARPADAAAPLVPPSDPAPPVAPPPVSGGGVRFDRRPGWDGHGQPPGA
ncbi:MAG TPA: zinc ribbon domain-containing protein, partial [Streptomyces sp.]|nr:zinc ribbon domain-containing protein [Streptomyces sp.]